MQALWEVHRTHLYSSHPKDPPWLWSLNYILKDWGKKVVEDWKICHFQACQMCSGSTVPPPHQQGQGSLLPLQRRKRRDLNSGQDHPDPGMAACLVPIPQRIGCMGWNRSTRDNRHLLVQTRMLTMWMEFWNMREFPWELQFPSLLWKRGPVGN